MKRYEIQIMVAEDDGSPMTLVDRCTIEADSAADAATRYAALFTDA